MKHLKVSSKSGKLLLFGGVYSNLQALEALMDKALELDIPPTNVICNGDAVGYCAQPEEVVKNLIDWGVNCIAGNVELQLAEGKDDCGCDFYEGSRCDLFSKQWYPYAKAALSKEAINWAKHLPETLSFDFEDASIGVVHGSAFETAEYIFKSTDWTVKQRNFEQLGVDTIIAGHCGLPFSETKDGFHWINPGVIGMPANDGQTTVWYAILESKEGKLIASHHRLAYDHKLAHQLMVENKLPSAYAKTLLTGIWDNCEILPASETNQQGESISFD